jgi:FKBP-type peptidyl-prolyl cis-trans isomerase FkpA
VIRRLGSVALLFAAAAACSDIEITTPEPQVIEQVIFHSDLEVDLSGMTQTESGLYYEDLEVGEGPVAEVGDSATVRYAGYLTTGVQFDAGELPPIELGGGQVIPGFDEGIRGMAVGGARKLVIPPDLAYGNRGSGLIPPGAVLIFDIELLALVEAES